MGGYQWITGPDLPVMPITPGHPVRRLSQEEFGELSYQVMSHVFDIHNEFGRFFDERIYKRELAARCPGVELEFPVTLSHWTFRTTCYLDALVGGGGAFEFKAVERLTSVHQGKLYNYLLLLDLAHGKLVNLRGESVEHEFVNSTLRPEERYTFEIVADRWSASVKGGDELREAIVGLLDDWGTGLELGMYEAALVHFLGGEKQVVREVRVRGQRGVVGTQTMRLVADGVAFRLTAFESDGGRFEDHARRLLRHVDLRAILWVNIGLRRVTFTTIESGAGL
ncbi:MAG TPA: GxxExxY protein [Planctomycetaceae bacterium]|nr:GxxExxY protein [Planctomycetaceae bacterium]